MKRKIKQHYNIKNVKGTEVQKLEPPKKEEKIIGFEDFERTEGQNDFSAFPTSFGGDWGDSPAKKEKEKKEEKPKVDTFKGFGFNQEPDQGNGTTNAFQDFSDFSGGFDDFSFKGQKKEGKNTEEEKQDEEFDLLGGGDD